MKSTPTYIVDTNVLVVANGEHADVSPDCIINCVTALDIIRSSGRIVIDDRYEVFSEYLRNTQPNTGNRVGDAFRKWVYQNQASSDHVVKVAIGSHPQRGYLHFPDDPLLANFDQADRKFVALSLAHADKPPILQGTDSKWVDWVQGLLEHGVNVKFICSSDLHKFARRKKLLGAKLHSERTPAKKRKARKGGG